MVHVAAEALPVKNGSAFKLLLDLRRVESSDEAKFDFAANNGPPSTERLLLQRDRLGDLAFLRPILGKHRQDAA
jgi:hypothetical protein